MTLTDGGKNHILDLLLGESTETLLNGGFGVDDDYAVSDTVLQSDVVVADLCDATTGWSEGGDAVAPTLNETSYKEGTGSINGGATHSAGEMYYTKTITSIDLSATNDKLYMFYYVEDITELTTADDGFYVQLGTGGQVNAYKYSVPTAIISNGWNTVVFTVNSDGSTIGTGADTSDIDSVRVGFKNGTSITIGDVRFDYIRGVVDGEFGIADSFSAITTSQSDKSVTITYKALSEESNGYDLSCAGISTSTILFTKQTFSAINKDENTEIQVDEFITVK